MLRIRLKRLLFYEHMCMENDVITYILLKNKKYFWTIWVSKNKAFELGHWLWMRIDKNPI